MIRRIIQIDKEKCTGCGMDAALQRMGSADRFREETVRLAPGDRIDLNDLIRRLTAMGYERVSMVEGKARLLRDDYCDGLGDCLPACPTGAITFVEREAAAYDEAAVQQHMAQKKAAFHGCPGSATKLFQRQAAPAGDGTIPSQLAQWPCQIRLISPGAPCFAGAHLLIAADCTAYAYANFHRDFMQGRVTLIGCPKLDAYDYAERLTAILAANSIQSVTLLRMEVPCCGGLEHAAHTALAASGKAIPLRVVTIRTNGTLL